MKSGKGWIRGYCIIVILLLLFIGITTMIVDPFFHYHKPFSKVFYYKLNNERSQNDGILKHFDYEGIIIGTSMIQNFKTSEANRVFGCSFVKVPYSGARYKEINEGVSTALKYNKSLKIVIRGLDMEYLLFEKDDARLDLGEYPTYLYDNNLFNDVKYLFNREIMYCRVFPMVIDSINGGKSGITSFDEYSNWMRGRKFGVDAIFPNEVPKTNADKDQAFLSEDEQQIVIENIEQNVVRIARDYPDVTFYYFLTPYSVAWWQAKYNGGKVNKQIEAQRILIERALQVSNIKLFSFNNFSWITTKLDNYKDTTHYGEWINSLILSFLDKEIGLLTKDNYEEYLAMESSYYNSYDYYNEFVSQKINEEDLYE